MPALPKAIQAGVIPLSKRAGVYVVPIQINNAITFERIIDSDPVEVNLPADVVLTLTRANTISAERFSCRRDLCSSRRIKSSKIRQIELGGVELKDVSASVGDVRGSVLIGQNLLERFNEWDFDNKNHVLRLK